MGHFLLFAFSWLSFNQASLFPTGPWLLLTLKPEQVPKKWNTPLPSASPGSWRSTARPSFCHNTLIISSCLSSFPSKDAAYLRLLLPLPYKIKIFFHMILRYSWISETLLPTTIVLLSKVSPYSSPDLKLFERQHRGLCPDIYKNETMAVFNMWDCSRNRKRVEEKKRKEYIIYSNVTFHRNSLSIQHLKHWMWSQGSHKFSQ